MYRLSDLPRFSVKILSEYFNPHENSVSLQLMSFTMWHQINLCLFGKILVVGGLQG